MSDHFDFDEETGEYVFDCLHCGAEIRTESVADATEYATRLGKRCPECDDDEF